MNRVLRRSHARLSHASGLIVALALALTSACSAGRHPESPHTATTPRVAHVRVIAMNDFHGNLEAPDGDNGTVYGPGGAKIQTGGAASLAATVAKLKAEAPGAVVVSAGDLTGASPLISGLFHDDPTVLAMNAIGLDLEAVGNHDFDHGVPAMRRLASGAPADGASPAFAGAHFAYLAANVIDTATGKPIFAPYAIREVDGVKIAFIGETLRGTPRIVVPTAVAGLDFRDEAETANALLPELKAQGVSAVVLVIHQGLAQSKGGEFDGCKDVSGDLLAVLDKLRPEIRIVVSGHTHQAYNCVLGDRVVTSAASYGRLVTSIDLTIDPAAHAITQIVAHNVPVTHDRKTNGEVEAIVSEYSEKARPITSRVVGHIAGDWAGSSRAAKSASCESPFGELIADAQAEATGADFALMNPGGVRAGLVYHRAGRPDGTVTYGEVFEAQPFGNGLVTLGITGAQLRKVLDAQFHGNHDPRVLLPSAGLTYRYIVGPDRKVTIDQIAVHGAPLDDSKTYRVTVNGFLATGGDGFGSLSDAKDRTEGPSELVALTSYLEKHGTETAPLKPPTTLTRIAGNGCQ